MKWVGTIHRLHVSGGVWILRAADGTRYQLEGADDALKVDGLAVELEGELTPGRMGIGMVGPTVRVTGYALI